MKNVQDVPIFWDVSVCKPGRVEIYRDVSELITINTVK